MRVQQEESPGSLERIFPDVCTFPDGGAGCSLFVFQSDLLECHKVVCELAFAFVDGGIGTLESEEKKQKRSLRLQRIPSEAISVMGLLAVPHLAQLVQLDVGLQFPKANLGLWDKRGRLKQAQGRGLRRRAGWRGGGRRTEERKEDAHQADTAEATAEGLVEDGAIEGQLLKVALGQPDISW